MPRLMLKKLPDWINPARLALNKVQLQGYAQVGQMSRLREVLFAPTDDLDTLNSLQIDCDWQFSLSQRQVVCEGSLTANLPLLCQRCLQPLDWHLHTDIQYCWLTDEEHEDQVSDEYEIVNMVEIPLKLATVIEEEVLLSLPLIAKHENCQVQHQQPLDPIQDDRTVTTANNLKAKPNPFELLKNKF